MNTRVVTLGIIAAVFILGGFLLLRGDSGDSTEVLGVGGAEPGVDMTFTDSDLVQVDGVVTEVFASADSIVVETGAGEEWVIALDSYTQVYSESGTLLEVSDFAILFEPGMSISVILDGEEEHVGSALVIRLMPEEDAEDQEVLMMRVWVV